MERLRAIDDHGQERVQHKGVRGQVIGKRALQNPLHHLQERGAAETLNVEEISRLEHIQEALMAEPATRDRALELAR